MGICFLIRFAEGNHAATRLSDAYPLGIWIAYNVAIGTAIACGGYAIAIQVHIRNRWQYHPLIRSAILTGLTGFFLVGFSAMLDFGRPWNSFGFFLPSPWQPDSFRSEVALGIMAYWVVQIIECLSTILCVLEHRKLKRLQKFIPFIQSIPSRMRA